MNIYLYQRRHNEGYIEWLRKEANTKISDRQTSKEKFRRRKDRTDFMKSNKDQNIAQRCADGWEDVQSREQFTHAHW